MALTPHRKKYYRDWTAIWALGGIALLVTSLLAIAWTSTYATISRYTDWGFTTTSLAALSPWLCMAVIGLSWEKVSPKRR